METTGNYQPLGLGSLHSHLDGAWLDGLTRVVDVHKAYPWEAALDGELREALERMMLDDMILGAARDGYALLEITGPSWWLMPSERRAQGWFPPSDDTVKMLQARGFPLWNPAEPGEPDQDQWLPAVRITATGVPVMRREPNP